MLQDIDLSYDRTGALTTGKSLKVGGVLSVAGVPVTAPSTPQPADHGLIAWASDPSVVTSSFATTNGSLYLASVYIRSSVTVAKCWFMNNAGATGVTAGQNFIGLYGPTGTLLSSAGIDTQIAAGGPSGVSLGAQQAVAAGHYWVGLLVNATGAPTVARMGGVSASGNNVNLSGASLRWAVNGTGLTALPGSITPASNSTTGALAIWAAVS